MASGFTVATTFSAKGNLGRKMKAHERGFGSLGRAATKAKRAVMGIGKGAVIGGAVAMAYGIRELKNEFVSLDQNITNASAKWGPEFDRGTQGFNDLLEAAKRVGLTTEHQSAQAAGGLNFLAMAGFTAAEAVALLPGLANLATAANLDFAQSADIASDSLGAFGKAHGTVEQKQSAFNKIMGQVSATVNNHNTDMVQWFEAVKQGAPAFTVAGQKMSTFNTAVALLANNGIKAEKAGTSLRGMMANLSKTTGRQAATMRQLGVSAQDSNGDFRDFADILEDIGNATEKMGTRKRTGILEQLFGKLQMSQAAILLQEGATRFREVRAEIEDSAGAEVELAGRMRKSIASSVALVESALLGKGIDIIQRLFGGDDPAEALTNLALKIQEFDVGPVVADMQVVIGVLKDSAMWLNENKEMLFALGKQFLYFKAGSFAVDILTGVRALAGAGGLVGAAGAATGAVGALNTALSMAGPLLASFVVGYAGGTLIWDQIEKSQKKDDARTNRAIKTTVGASTRGRSEVEAELKERTKGFDKDADFEALSKISYIGRDGRAQYEAILALKRRIAVLDAEEAKRFNEYNRSAGGRVSAGVTEEWQGWQGWDGKQSNAAGGDIYQSERKKRMDLELRRARQWQEGQRMRDAAAAVAAPVKSVQRNETAHREERIEKYEVDWGTPPPGVTVNRSPLSSGDM